MTIAQNVAFPLRQHTQKTPDEIQQIVLARLAEVGLPENVLARSRPSFPAACGSASAWPGRWPWSRK